jgi:hypothetical protein
MKRLLIFGLILGLIYSCSGSSIKQPNRTIELPDNLFALKNVHNSSFINKVKFIDNRLFLDSSKQVEFFPLDSNLKGKILAPILKMDLRVESDYVKSFIISYFISKQDKIGDYQPVIIWASGDDYTSLILAVLDSNLCPISHIILYGGQFAGPYEINDSLTSWGEEKQSIIEGNQIKSTVLTTYVWTDSRNDSAFIDSISYKSKILGTGKIMTEKLDSIRIIKKIND